MTDEQRKNLFIELAKAKTQPTNNNLKAATDETISQETVDESEGQLTVDVFQDKDDIVVQSTVAGVNPDDLEISITNESVTIRGKREKTEAVEEKDYFYQECFWGTFSRSIILPQEIDAEKSSASFKNGILTIRMPKLNRLKTRKLKVKLDNENSK